MEDDIFATLDFLDRAGRGEQQGGFEGGGLEDEDVLHRDSGGLQYLVHKPVQRVPVKFGDESYEQQGICPTSASTTASRYGVDASDLFTREQIGNQGDQYPTQETVYESSQFAVPERVAHISQPSDPFTRDTRVNQDGDFPNVAPRLSQYAYQEPPRQTQTSSPERALSSSPTFKASKRQIERINLPKASQRLIEGPCKPSHAPAPRPTQPSLGLSRTSKSQQALNLPHMSRLVQGIEIRSTHELPDRFRSVFSFPNFNAVQSKCFSTVYETNDNFVLSSPTGSGKTAVFELAICRVINGYQPGQFKIVYQAPTKSLCSERVRDWQNKFRTFDIECAELTGDTDATQLRHAQSASIIITTPEKWDSITRKWKDHVKLMNMIKLFLIDEVHMVKEGRGATLEAVVSRMKSIQSNVRFIALSATVPNSNDIATWLGRDYVHQNEPAREERFGEEFRPVRLQKHVVGYPANGNDFAFEGTLNAKLPDVISKYSHRKPLMVFCFTRKSCEGTANALANWWSTKGSRDRYWEGPRKPVKIKDKALQNCISAGVAWHHAGLPVEVRHIIEQGFLDGNINVICCTSTLAVGVNLPCHFVIIKNTVTYAGPEGLKEYSDLEIMQMLGRAGRPQYDSSAVALIMTRQEKVEKYNKMVSGQEILESCLHEHLIDHLNAEIGLGTITNLSTAKKWLRGTFFYVRLQENPHYYRLDGIAGSGNLDARLEAICCRDIELLREHELIEGDGRLISTQFGNAMARYCVQFDTAVLFLAIPDKAKISEILSALANAAEFKEIRLRGAEKPNYKQLNNSTQIRYPIRVTLASTAHKVSLIIQSQLGGVDFPIDEKTKSNTFQYNLDIYLVFQHVMRLIRCIVDFKLIMEDSVSLRNALFLCRSLGARCWDDSSLQLKQIDQIGIVGARKLVNAGIKSIEILEHTESHRIERALQRNPPFGLQILDSVRGFPKLRVSIEVVGKPVVKAGQGAEVSIKAEIGFMNEKSPQTYRNKPIFLVFLAEISDGHLVHFARASAKKVSKGETLKFSVNLTSPAQTICCHIMCDEFAGTLTSASLKPTVPSIAWPAEKTEIEDAEGLSNKSKPRMNSSKHRSDSSRQASNGRPSTSDEFDDGFLDDADLLAAVGGSGDLEFRHIDSFGHTNSASTRKNTKENVASQKPNATESDWQPTKLSNGKWECNHNCKDKSACKHLCCREGTDKPRIPKAPKKRASDESVQKEDPTPKQVPLKQKLQKGQTTLKLQKVAKLKPLPSMDDTLEEMDLTGEPDKPQRTTSKPPPADLVRLGKLHDATQKNALTPISRPVHQHASTRRLERTRSFLPNQKEIEVPKSSSDYGSDFELLDLDTLMESRHESSRGRVVESVHGQRVAQTASPKSKCPYSFSDSDGLMAEAMVGLSGSQDLRNVRVDDDLYALPESQPDYMDLDHGHIEQATTSLILQPDSPNAKRGPFLEESSSPFFGQPQKSKLNAKRPAPKDNATVLEPKPNKRHATTVPGHSDLDKVAQTPKAAEASSSPAAKVTLEDIDPSILQEFGDYVDFV